MPIVLNAGSYTHALQLAVRRHLGPVKLRLTASQLSAEMGMQLSFDQLCRAGFQHANGRFLVPSF